MSGERLKQGYKQSNVSEGPLQRLSYRRVQFSRDALTPG
jgi:hypothetical protein